MEQDASRGGSGTSGSRWLYGPAPDLLLGCGVGYALVFLGLLAFGAELKTWLPITLLAMVSLVAGGPHYGATLVRVYAQRTSRQRYAIFAVWITGVLALAFVASLHFHALGTALVTLYFLWSPWHYSGQNYGITLMFLHRRGMPVTPGFKRLLHAAFVISFLLAVVQVNGTSPGAIFAPNAPDPGAPPTEAAYRAVPLGIEPTLQNGIMAVGVCAYLVCLAALASHALRRGSARDLIPAAAVVLTQSLWFVVPATARYWGVFQDSVPTGYLHGAYAFQFVAAGHAVQYLWVTAYYAQRAGETRGAGRFYLSALLAGTALWSVPFLLLGGVTHEIGYEALLLLVAAIVNLHHFVLDGAIWKLRDAGVGSVLLRGTSAPPASAESGSRHRWLRPLAWTLGGLCLLVSVASNLATHEFMQGLRRANYERAHRAVQWLSWLQQDDFRNHRRVGFLAARRGRGAEALEAFDRSLALRDTADAWYGKAIVHAARGESDEALAIYEALHERLPDNADVVRLLADTYVETGRVEQARSVLREMLSRGESDPQLEQRLAELESR